MSETTRDRCRSDRDREHPYRDGSRACDYKPYGRHQDNH